MSETPEHGREPIPGLPDYLPEGERILWQGAPNWKQFAIRALHVRKVAIYFALLFAWRLLGDGAPIGHVGLLLMATLAIGLLLLLGWSMARSALYTITNHRVVMRFGIALPMSINLPFEAIDSVDMRQHGSGAGDIAIVPRPGGQIRRLSWVVMWPHARPWRTSPVQPMLRCLDDADQAAGILADALSTHFDTENVRHAVRTDRPMPDKGRAARPRPPKSPGFPLPPLIGAATLVGVALVGVTWLRLTAPPPPPPPIDQAVASVQLMFEDVAGGSIRVYDAGSGTLLEEIPPGADNFMRATLRGLVRSRGVPDADRRLPFGLYRLADGRLLLVDAVTGDAIDLWAFGRTNGAAFARFLPAGRDGVVASNDDNVQARATRDDDSTKDNFED